MSPVAPTTPLPSLVFSRKYFAHLGFKGTTYTLDDVQDNAMESTRRLYALLQACLMRELGISATDTETLMNLHYSN